MFWEVVEEAQQSRSRFRTHRELVRLRERETARYTELGVIGFALLREQISVERTPETSRILTEIERLHAEQARQRRSAGHHQPLEQTLPLSWRRLERFVQTGEWSVQIHVLPESSPWCGRPMNAAHPPGLCLAIKRGDAVHPFTPEAIGVAGDRLIIVAPASCISAWDDWVLRGQPRSPDAT
jgi:hypothetical protein